MLGRSGGVAILLLCWCGSCQSAHAVVVQQQIPTLQQVRPSNKIEKKSPMRSTLLRAVVAKQRIRLQAKSRIKVRHDQPCLLRRGSDIITGQDYSFVPPRRIFSQRANSGKEDHKNELRGHKN